MFSQSQDVSLYDSKQEKMQIQTEDLQDASFRVMNYEKVLSFTYWNPNWLNTVSAPKYLIHEISGLLYYAIKEDMEFNILMENVRVIFSKRFHGRPDISNKLIYYTKILVSILSQGYFHNCGNMDIKLYQGDSAKFENLFFNDNVKSSYAVLNEMINCVGFDFGSRLLLAAYAVVHNVSIKKFRHLAIKRLNSRKTEINRKVSDFFVKSTSLKVVNNTKHLTLNLHTEFVKYYNAVNRLLKQHGFGSNL